MSRFMARTITNLDGKCQLVTGSEPLSSRNFAGQITRTREVPSAPAVPPCYVEGVTPRHIALIVAAVAVLGVGLYLYIAVNSTSSAVANVRPRSPAEPTPQDHEPPPYTPPPSRVEQDAARPRPTVALNDAVRDVAAKPTLEMSVAPGAGIDLKKDEMMASANKAYDHGDFDEAMMIAKKVLSNDPTNARMLRIVISASCILDDAATAQKSYLLLPAGGNDRADMKRRCDRYGVTFTES